MFILHLVKNSKILVNEDRSLCMPIVGEISVNDFPTVCHLFFYYYLISWLTLNWNSLGCFDYFNNNQDYILFNFYCLKLQHTSKNMYIVNWKKTPLNSSKTVTERSTKLYKNQFFIIENL
jgi:hypothetical protein